jgi:hypothetical protein
MVTPRRALLKDKPGLTAGFSWVRGYPTTVMREAEVLWRSTFAKADDACSRSFQFIHRGCSRTLN